MSLALLLVASLAPYLTSSTELVRIRNALLYDPTPAEVEWTPTTVPNDYLVERTQATPLFTRVVEKNLLVVPGDDWQTALRIGRHMLSGVIDRRGSGGPIHKGLSTTYREITSRGRGYCGDYVDVFTALADASGVFARAWEFSFDGFDGGGHIFNEIWDRKTASWRFIDVFNNYYVVDENERPLSALEFHEALVSHSPIRWRFIEPRARPGYVYPEKAVDYYRRGADEWYLSWGNNAFEYDANRVVSLLNAVAPALAQFSAIVLGVYPKIRVLDLPENERQRDALERLKSHMYLVAACLPALLLIMIVALGRMMADRRCVPVGRGLLDEGR